MTVFSDVEAFHAVCGHPIGEVPQRTIPDDRMELRLRLIIGEVSELICAMAGRPEMIDRVQHRMTSLVAPIWHLRKEPDLEGIADGIADVLYVSIGTGVEFGLPQEEVWAEVQRTNLLKASGGKDPGGKSLKPEGWTPPDIAGILARASS